MKHTISTNHFLIAFILVIACGNPASSANLSSNSKPEENLHNKPCLKREVKDCKDRDGSQLPCPKSIDATNSYFLDVLPRLKAGGFIVQ